MTGPKRNSEFCFPEQNSLFPAGQVIKCFVIPPNSKTENKTAKNRLLYADSHEFATVNCFKEHDLITRESKVQVVVSLTS